MNKLVLSFVILAVVVAALFTTASVFAQGPAPQSQSAGTAMGRGPRGGSAGTVQGGPNQNLDGYLHDDRMAFYADKLGLSVDELNARLATGETLSQIAYSTGLSVDEFRSLMVEARGAALQQAVANGTLTQSQAEWMAQHGAGMAAGGYGRGMRGAAAGSGLGQFANPDCPYLNATPAQ